MFLSAQSISPGTVKTEIFTERALEFLKDMPMLEAEDISDAVMYVLGTPPHVQVNHFLPNPTATALKTRISLLQIHELIIKPVGEKF